MSFKIYLLSAAISTALFAPTSGAHAQDIPCTTKLAALTATQKTFEAQLDSIPQNISVEGKTKGNRLYEQIMLENITILSEIRRIKTHCNSKGATTDAATDADTDADTDATTVASLQSEITILKGLVAELSLENKKLNILMEQLSDKITSAKAISPCDERQQILATKLDELRSLGYDAAHPDIINVSLQLDAVAHKCSAEPNLMNASGSCIMRLTTIEKKLDQLMSLGYRDNHPDIINISRQLKTAGDECSVSSSKG